MIESEGWPVRSLRCNRVDEDNRWRHRIRCGSDTAEIVLNKDNKIKFVEDDILTRPPARQAENYIYIYPFDIITRWCCGPFDEAAPA